MANKNQPTQKQVIRDTCGFRCPSCCFDLTILLDFPSAKEPNYCPECGQKLKWSDSDGK